DVLAATLGFWAARAIISAQRDVAPGWGLATCLSAQAGVGLSVREKDALFTAALAFKVSLDSALQLTNNRLASERERGRIRLVFRAACGSICSASSSRDPPATGAQRRQRGLAPRRPPDRVPCGGSQRAGLLPSLRLRAHVAHGAGRSLSARMSHLRLTLNQGPAPSSLLERREYFFCTDIIIGVAF
ncbi:hypothetical protein MTO96_037502, partial [Rhipicephalus appendiculatus]